MAPKPSPSQIRRAASAAASTKTTTKHSSLLVSALKQAANFTVRGATITFGSTLLSCYAACCIEQGSHRLLYKYFPHKYAQVEWANGLTQEQLDAVRVVPTQQPLPVVQQQHQQQQQQEQVEVGDMLWEAAALELESTTGHEQRIDFKANTDSTRTSSSSLSASSTRFWNEQKQQQQQLQLQQPGTEARRFQLPSLSVSINEIQACAMTG
mmetsp:Transcript_13279/g.32417  ORF Transcript_13279/g.32417 Transcript_13279/m.32417 type:complete len:210 (-) Transcript_13279:629-1258(-)|eukprot:CAMPEP_0113465392 /NCGR_PEP_ID=MMETSP0014_2-20120614/13713_1 /TAXON_ID=2857 /ORGANISM="Nitzschia sp." /LENGTH=209 /DNA_ID=CAMNT_0000357543 /DNA_START=414 /DNA_END=1043 /DNA_ORIENTATION=- /assembly_acc=CAM_ASM_000159